MLRRSSMRRLVPRKRQLLRLKRPRKLLKILPAKMKNRKRRSLSRLKPPKRRVMKALLLVQKRRLMRLVRSRRQPK